MCQTPRPGPKPDQRSWELDSAAGSVHKSWAATHRLRLNAWMPECSCNWLAAYWPSKWQGWDWASGDSEADLHVSWQRGLKTVRCEWLCYVCEPAFCWAWLNINKRGITKVWRHLLGSSHAEGLVRVDFFQLCLDFAHFLVFFSSACSTCSAETKIKYSTVKDLLSFNFSPLLSTVGEKCTKT